MQTRPLGWVQKTYSIRPAVVIPILTQHYIMLQRNLIYTGITRGKNLVVIIGTKKSLAIAVNNAKTKHMPTGG